MKMKLLIIICVVCAIRYLEASEVPSVCLNNSGSFGYEVLLGKLEDVELKLWNMLLEMKGQIDNHIRSKDTHKEVMMMLTKLENRSTEILHQHQVQCSSLGDPNSYKSCAEAPWYRSGKYMIHPLGFEKPFEAYCEQKVLDGGWIVVQYRFDGSIDFQRDWIDYKNGFGRINGEFWIGLEKLHRLTKGGGNQLLVELKTFNGSYKIARYDEFEIGNESEKYELKELGSYRGTAGDGLAYHKNKKFSTEDIHNDERSGNCAKTFRSGWWYHKCFKSNLNGFYTKKNGTNDGIIWYYVENHEEVLAYSRMMIRKTP